LLLLVGQEVRAVKAGPAAQAAEGAPAEQLEVYVPDLDQTALMGRRGGQVLLGRRVKREPTA
jgi:hypothetical protein